jgi:hypothetical protein
MILEDYQPRSVQACAENLKRSLESIGLSAAIEVLSQVTKVHVTWNGKPWGAACLYPSTLGVRVSTHEMKDIPLMGVVQACAENRLYDARRLLEREERALKNPPEYSIHVAACINDHASETAYGAAVFKGGERVGSFAGRCDGGQFAGRAIAAAEALEWCHDRGIESVCIFDDEYVMKWAEGIFQAGAEPARIWVATYAQCDLGVRWMPCDHRSDEYREAKACAEAVGDYDDESVWDYWNSRAA